ncbi:unnamed protein product [Sphagnum jensenii]
MNNGEEKVSDVVYWSMGGVPYFAVCESGIIRWNKASRTKGDEEEETDQLVSQVLDEIGVDLNSQLVHAPAHVAAAPAQTTPSKVAQPTGAFNAGDDAGIDSDLQAHFDNLRKM